MSNNNIYNLIQPIKPYLQTGGVIIFPADKKLYNQTLMKNVRDIIGDKCQVIIGEFMLDSVSKRGVIFDINSYGIELVGVGSKQLKRVAERLSDILADGMVLVKDYDEGVYFVESLNKGIGI